eukprot:scaffold16636_cov64-Phaeocystis_antarctica.AAC.2
MSADWQAARPSFARGCAGLTSSVAAKSADAAQRSPISAAHAPQLARSSGSFGLSASPSAKADLALGTSRPGPSSSSMPRVLCAEAERGSARHAARLARRAPSPSPSASLAAESVASACALQGARCSAASSARTAAAKSPSSSSV